MKFEDKGNTNKGSKNRRAYYIAAAVIVAVILVIIVMVTQCGHNSADASDAGAEPAAVEREVTKKGNAAEGGAVSEGDASQKSPYLHVSQTAPVSGSDRAAEDRPETETENGTGVDEGVDEAAEEAEPEADTTAVISEEDVEKGSPFSYAGQTYPVSGSDMTADDKSETEAVMNGDGAENGPAVDGGKDDAEEGEEPETDMAVALSEEDAPVKSPYLYVSQTAPVNTGKDTQKPLEAVVDWNGYELEIEAYTGYAIITYPDVVTPDDISAFCSYAYDRYSGYLDGVGLSVTADGKARVTYPTAFGKDEFDAAVGTLGAELPSYIESIVETAQRNAERAEAADAVFDDTSEAEISVDTTSDSALPEDPAEEAVISADADRVPAEEVAASSGTTSDTVPAEEPEAASDTLPADTSEAATPVDTASDSIQDGDPRETIASPEETVTSVDADNAPAELSPDPASSGSGAASDYEVGSSSPVSSKKQTVTIWGTPYGLAERVVDGKSFNIRRFARSYIWAFNVEYDYKISDIFTVGFKAGCEGIILHVGGYKSQVPLMATVGFVPYENGHSRIDLVLGVGFDVVESASEKTFAPVAGFSFTYKYKLGELSFGVGTDVRFEYTMSNKDMRFELMPVKLGIGYTF